MVISLLYLWGICCLFTFTKMHRWYLSSFVVAAGTALQFGINAIVDRALAARAGPDKWDCFSAVCILISAACMLAVYG
ncbi:MAG TPA: hypothetical protein GXX74_01695 [Clostridiales bacterium]|nr:hypothetical protein [Clostridiales bacterium]